MYKSLSVTELLWSGQGSNPRPPARQITVYITIYMIFNLTRLSYLLTNGNIRIILLTSYNLFLQNETETKLPKFQNTVFYVCLIKKSILLFHVFVAYPY